MRLAFLFLLGCVAVGCSANEDSFNRAVTRIGCQYQRKCAKADWEHRTVRACVKDRYEEESAFSNLCEEEEYDAKAARRCLRALRKNRRTCGDAYEEAEALTETCSAVCGIPVGINEYGLHVYYAGD